MGNEVMTSQQAKLITEYKSHHLKIIQKIDEVLLSGRYILGKEVRKFERNFAKYLGVKYVVGVGNGFDALYLSLLVAPKGNVVVINPLHVSIINACKYANRNYRITKNRGFRSFILVESKYSFVIQDACRMVGNQNPATIHRGDISCFSFHPLKKLHCYGDGGAIATDDRKLYMKLLILRNHGRMGKSQKYLTGVNSRLDGIQAAVLNIYLDDFRLD
jgi:dTDP-4-amino-4,6-dideoxygalactose transaminase